MKHTTYDNTLNVHVNNNLSQVQTDQTASQLTSIHDEVGGCELVVLASGYTDQ